MWELALPIASALLGGASSGDKQQTQSLDPWAAAQPWMTSNLGIGQQLQSQYAANPLSDYQKQAYANSAGTNNQTRSLSTSLMDQLNNFTGYTRQNPGTVTPFNFSSGAPASKVAGQISGNLGFSVNPGQASQMADLQAQIAALKALQLENAQRSQPEYRSGQGGANGYSLSSFASRQPGSEQSGDSAAGRTNDRGGYGSGGD